MKQQVVAMKTKRMSGKDQESRENMLPSADMTQFMNIARDNRE